MRLPGITMIRAPGDFAEGVHFFAQTTHPWTKTMAGAFYTWLHHGTGLSRIEMSIEDGWWFAGDPSYPVYNRFLPRLKPPTFEEFKKHTRFYCSAGDVFCLQRGPARN